MGDWLEAGTRVVWPIDPERRLARVYRRDGSETSITEQGNSTGKTSCQGSPVA